MSTKSQLKLDVQKIIESRKFKKKERIFHSPEVRKIAYFLPDNVKSSQVLARKDVDMWRSKIENHLRFKGLTTPEIKSILVKAGFNKHLRKMGQLQRVFEKLSTKEKDDDEDSRVIGKSKGGGYWLYSKTEKFVQAGIVAARVSGLHRYLDLNPHFAEFDIDKPETWDREIIDNVRKLLDDYDVKDKEDFTNMVNGAWDHDPRYEGWFDRFLRELYDKMPIFEAYSPGDIARWIDQNFF